MTNGGGAHVTTIRVVFPPNDAAGMTNAAAAVLVLVLGELDPLTHAIRDGLASGPLTPDVGSIAHNRREIGVATIGQENVP